MWNALTLNFSMILLTPKDNDNYPTLEVFNEDTDERIFSNNPVSNEDR